MVTLSPKRQYLGMVEPTTPATQGPEKNSYPIHGSQLTQKDLAVVKELLKNSYKIKKLGQCLKTSVNKLDVPIEKLFQAKIFF